MSVPSSVHVDSDGIVGQNLVAGNLRRQIFFRVLIIELIIVVDLAGDFIGVFNKIPEHRVVLAAYPLDRIAALKDLLEASVVVDRIIIIFLSGFVPYSGIDDHLGSVGH